jgi:hypothetical protein
MSEPAAAQTAPSQPLGNRPPDTMSEAIDATPELARKNNVFALWLTLVFILLFGGTFLVGLLYNSVTTT